VPVPIWWLKASPEAFGGLSDLGLIQTQLPYDVELGLGFSAEGELLGVGVVLE
jgi:hypothetical protein